MALNRFSTLAIAGAIVAGLFATATTAQDAMMMTEMPDVSSMSVAEIIALRQATMRSNGATIRGANELTGADAVAAANQIVSNARTLKLLFPEGANVGDSRALDLIWQDWDNFIANLDKLEADALAAAAAAEAGDQDAFVTAIGETGSNCGNCHGTYRGA